MKTDSETITGKRILLVEDERILRETMRGMLAQDQHIVTEANNGAEAFTLFIQGQYDLVMTDSVMPLLSGAELAQRIKQIAPRQPILMLTAHKSRPGPRNPVDAVVEKPCDYNRLRQEIARLL